MPNHPKLIQGAGQVAAATPKFNVYLLELTNGPGDSDKLEVNLFAIKKWASKPSNTSALLWLWARYLYVIEQKNPCKEEDFATTPFPEEKKEDLWKTMDLDNGQQLKSECVRLANSLKNRGDIVQSRKHEGLFIQTKPNGYGRRFQVVGGIMAPSGMSYDNPKNDYLPQDSRDFGGLKYVGYIDPSKYDDVDKMLETVDGCLKKVHAPKVQQAINWGSAKKPIDATKSKTAWVQDLKEGTTDRNVWRHHIPLKIEKCNEWTEKAINKLADDGILTLKSKGDS
ncbi:hypothetical protein N7466_000288 [Penicillium verhagenii]|uniref:uncharacterized protein n=1 Tax=Penicillium verhagenii TaxID=1562060 RepID=UPI00254598CA|nr:uncharacterized protein N7466_000288 [Penicillium verhagenii]KAJ5947273.1 hypothetical protein N7466_000288 [Penicillium verhagenii]